jgi:acetyl-CoA C-acetyltransferase
VDDRTPVIVSAVRTPIGKFGGGLSRVPAPRLGAIAIAEAVARAGIAPERVDEVLMGNVLSAGLGMNPARQASMRGGLPESVPATTVNKVCGSGLKAVALAAQAIRVGDADVVVAAGAENMSSAPYLDFGARFGYRSGHGQLVDSMLTDGLWCALEDCHMGNTAEAVAREYGVSREEQDRFALGSQQKAARAWADGAFLDEVVAVPIEGGATVERDEHPRPEVTPERLGQLGTSFEVGGTVTAGNASGINDGAAAVVVMSAAAARDACIEPLATVLASASAGVSPRLMGIGPIPAVRRVLERAALGLDEIDLIEANEAYAAQSVAVGRELGWDESRVNVNGGAIALGHPLGASGVRILVTLVHALRQRELRRGLATLCIGGGQGIAMVIERG